MKKIIRKGCLLAAGLLMAMFIMPKTVLAAESIPVTVVEDITNVQDVTSENYKVGPGAYSNTVQFSLDKPAYVYVSAYSTVMREQFYNLGNIRNFAVYSDANLSNLVNNDESRAVNGNQRVSKYLCLDAGTYWVYFAKGAGDEDAAKSEGEFRLSVAAKYLDVTATKNGSWAKAKAVSTDKNVSGFLSSATRTGWYKFSVSDGTVARLSVSLENPLGVRNFPLSATGVTLYKSSHKYVTSFNVTDQTYYQKAFSPDMTLSAGTYYLAVSGDESYDQWEKTKLVGNEHKNMGVVNLRITTIKKPSISSLVNVKGKKVQVTSKKVSGAKGYEVQYALDSRFKKGAKIVGSKGTKTTLKGLKKNQKYYVRVRAYRIDEEGNKLTGAWSKAKSVKINK